MQLTRESEGEMKSARTFICFALSVIVCSAALLGCSVGPDEQTRDVISLIDEIGDVTLDSDEAIGDALSAYDGLSDSQKEFVENYDVLVDAQETLDGLVEEQKKANQVRANEVVALIDAIGTVSLKSEGAVTKARKAYEALTSAQQMLVSNKPALIDAENKIEELKKQMSVGETVKSSQWEITLTAAYISDTLQSSESSLYWEPADGGTFVILEFDLMVLTSDNVSIDDDAITDLVAKYKGNTYASWEMNYLSGQLWIPIWHTGMDANIPLHIYVYTTLPHDALDNGDVTVSMTLADQEKTIAID